MSQQQVRQQFTAALDALVSEIKKDRSILAAILCGSLSHDTVWAKSDIDLVLVTIDDETAQARRSVPLRRRRQRARHASCRAPSSASRRRIACTTRSCTRFWPRDGCSTRTTRRSRELCERLQELGERDTQIAAAPRRHRRAPALVQGAQMVDHARRPRLHRAVDPLCGDGTGAVEVIAARTARRPRSHAAGADAQPGILSNRLHRPAQRAEDTRDRRRPRSTPRTATWRARRARVRCRARLSAAKPASRGRPPRSRITSSATSASAAS